jgi:hypothetical protein
MDGDVFANLIVIADDQRTEFGARAEMLRLAAQDGPLANLIAPAKRCAGLDHDVTCQLTAIANSHSGLDHTARTNRHLASQVGLGTDGGASMNLSHYLPPIAGDCRSIYRL